MTDSQLTSIQATPSVPDAPRAPRARRGAAAVIAKYIQELSAAQSALASSVGAAAPCTT
jgi:hypothetical protein